MKRREFTLVLTVRDSDDGPIGRHLVALSHAVVGLLEHLPGLRVERSDVRGRELDAPLVPADVLRPGQTTIRPGMEPRSERPPAPPQEISR